MNDPLTKWHKADIIFKALGTILLPVTLIFLSFYLDSKIEKSRSDQARIKLYTEMMSQKEAANAQLRKDVLQSAVYSFCLEKDNPFEKRLLAMEILTHNFHEDFDLKPLFTNLYQQCRSSGSRDDTFSKRLMNLADLVKNRQLKVFKAVGYKTSRQLDFIEKDEKPYGEFELEGIRRIFTLTPKKADFYEKEIMVSMKIKTFMKGNGNEVIIRYDLSVSFFDTPATSNMRLSENQRCAIIIEAMSPNEDVADIALLYFSGKYASLQERPYTEDVIKQYDELIREH